MTGSKREVSAVLRLCKENRGCVPKTAMARPQDMEQGTSS